MEQRICLRRFVRDEVVSMRAGFKNVVQQRVCMAQGALSFAYQSDIITKEEWSDGWAWVDKEAVRSFGGFDNVEKYADAALEAECKFESHFR